MGNSPSATEKNDLAERRRRLQGRIKTHTKSATTWIGLEASKEVPEEDKLNDVGQNGFVVRGAGHNPRQKHRSARGRRQDRSKPEFSVLVLPSSLGEETAGNLGLQELCKQEISLRIGQVNDALNELRLSLGEKSLLLRKKVRNANSQRKSTRAWDEVHKVSRKVTDQVGAYRRARNALEFLNVDAGTMTRYKLIEDEDLKMPGDLTEENRVGQRSEKMAWFWRMDGGKDLTDNSWMAESE